MVELTPATLQGIFTFDNIDYVLRDAYMTGVSIGPIDWRRLLHYTSFRKKVDSGLEDLDALASVSKCTSLSVL